MKYTTPVMHSIKFTTKRGKMSILKSHTTPIVFEGLQANRSASSEDSNQKLIISIKIALISLFLVMTECVAIDHR